MATWLVLALVPRRRGPSFWLSLAGTLGLASVLGPTFLELPLNRQTPPPSLNAPRSWLERRPRWDPFNSIRTLLGLGGWSGAVYTCWRASSWGELKLCEAAVVFGRSMPYAATQSALVRAGRASLAHGNRGRPSPRRLSAEFRHVISHNQCVLAPTSRSPG